MEVSSGIGVKLCVGFTLSRVRGKALGLELEFELGIRVEYTYTHRGVHTIG